MRGKQFRIGKRVFEQFFHHVQEFLGLICRYAVEAEARGVFVLTEEILEEVVYDIAMTVECHEVS